MPSVLHRPALSGLLSLPFGNAIFARLVGPDRNRHAFAFADTEQKLERLFERYCAQKISINSYVLDLETEIASLNRGIKAQKFGLRAIFVLTSGYKREMEQRKQALSATQWCLDWAKDRRQTDISACLETADDLPGTTPDATSPA